MKQWLYLPMLYNTSLQPIYLIHSSSYLLISFPYPMPPTLFPLHCSHQFVLYIREFVSFFLYSLVCFIFQILLISDDRVFVCLTYFTNHNVLLVHPHCWRWQNFILFLTEQYSSAYVCMCTYTTSSLFIHLSIDT